MITKDSVFTWYIDYGVSGHLGKGWFDVGFSFMFDELVLRFVNEFLAVFMVVLAVSSALVRSRS